jgi:predicted MFS family arabinose efflux permease
MQPVQPATVSAPPIPAIAIPLLSFAAFASGLSLRVTDPLLPDLATGFGISLAEAAHVITAFSVAYGISQLFFGPVGDRYGKYLVVGYACLACALTSLLCALAPNYEFLVLARLLAGATAAALIPLSMAWIGDVIPYKDRQPILARFLIGQILGLSSGVLLGGFAADANAWRAPFYGIAVFYILNSAALLRLNARLPAEARILRKSTGGSTIKRMLSEFHQVLQKPWARVVLMTVFLEGCCVYGSFAFIASHLHHTFGLSLAKAGALVMLYGFGGFLFAIASAKLVSTLGETGLVFGGGLLIAASFFSIGIAPAWWWAIPACFIAGLGFYMLHNTLQTNATQMAPERRGAAVSAFASSYFLGQSAGVAIAGLIAVRVGTSAVLVAGSIGLLLVAGNFFRALRAKRLA